jgi:phosphomannomutase
LELVLATVDVPRIRSKRFRVLLDSNHGAGSLLGRRLLEALGCRAEIAGIPPDGQFEHPPEPVNENLRDACRLVVKTEAEVGFCQDPDADRLAVIDESGRPLGEEYTLALCLDHVLSKQPGAVVTNCATSRISHDVAGRHNSPSFQSAVGEANVVDMMIRESAVFGGEGNGGPIDPRVGYVRDSFVGMALLLDFMAVRDKPISELADGLPRYEIVKQKVSLSPERLAGAFDALERHFVDAKKSRIDGLRLDWPDRWLLVRGSNTEPIVRVIAEAPLQGDAQVLCRDAGQVLTAVQRGVTV